MANKLLNLFRILYMERAPHLLLPLLFLVSIPECFSQLQIFPLQEAPVRPSLQNNAQARMKELTPMTLPFWDDFSRPSRKKNSPSFIPDTLLWENSLAVWVNDGMAINAPTLNVATFDGLGADGLPYNATEIFQNGFTDSLTSRKIDLSEAALPLAERGGVYLSFMYQWRGNGEAPDEGDYLELQFRNAQKNWETILTIQSQQNDFRRDLFYNAITKVEEERFFHTDFQFRFRSFGRESGPFDTWNLDYVYMNKGRTGTDLSFPDRALATQLGPLFGDYRAMPKKHFLTDAQRTPPNFEIQNMKNIPASVNFRTEGFFSSTNKKSGATVTHEAVIARATPINITDNVLLANEHKLSRLDTLPTLSDPLQFPPNMDSTLVRLTITLQSSDNVPQNNAPPIEPDSTGDYTPNYSPILFTNNDKLTADYVLSSYYAYDDGIAEYAAGLIEAGNLVAYQFEMPDGLEQDTLVAFDIHFPPYGITSNQTVDFFIYHDDGAGKPGEIWLRIPARSVSSKGINQFQRLVFYPALLINEKRFYIGWKHPVAGTTLVGLDISNDTGDRIFVNTNGTWYLNDNVKGSLMLRPIFGTGEVDMVKGTDEAETAFAVFPNPSKGIFYVKGAFDSFEILSLTGQRVPFEAVNDTEKTTLQFQAPAGLYLLRCIKGASVKTHKLLLIQ